LKKISEIKDDEEFLFFAATHYYRPRSTAVDDFYDDIHRIKYIKRLVNRFMETGNLSERLLLNHIIVVGNSFTIPAAIKIFEYKLNEKSWRVLKPFLVHLKYIEESAYPNIKSNIVVERQLKSIFRPEGN